MLSVCICIYVVDGYVNQDIIYVYLCVCMYVSLCLYVCVHKLYIYNLIRFLEQRNTEYRNLYHRIYFLVFHLSLESLRFYLKVYLCVCVS